MSTTLTALLEAHFPEKDARPSLSIYEVGVGTGRLAEMLVKAGFTNIEGIEPCEALLKLAQEKGNYKHLKARFCGTGDLEEERKGAFDIAAGCGVFAKNHIPASGFQELLDSLKNGGVVVFPVREDEWTGLGYKEKAEALEKEGKWKLLQREVKANWVKSEVQLKYIYSLYQKL